MAKTIKVIDLLNKIANGEEVPEKIKIGFKNFHYCKACECYEDEYERDLVIKYNDLNDTVEIIEEQQDIDIQEIEDIKDVVAISEEGYMTRDTFINITEKIN